MKNLDLLLKKAQSGDVEAQYQYGMQYLFVDSPIAFKWLKEAASKNHHGALWVLGSIFFNKAEHIEQLKREADLNDPVSCFVLGQHYLYAVGVERDTHKGQELLAKASEGGMALPAFNLGIMYLNGELLSEKDHKKAIHWFKEAYRLGSDVSACALMHIYNGKYDPEDADPKQAEYWNHIVDQLLDEGKLNDE